jgi:hypothetical protein
VSLPDFFVIGVPKAGTTALHVALAQHPQLFMSSIKEPKYFLTDGPPPARGGPGDAKTFREYVWRRTDYEALFADAAAGLLRGESTPFYLYDPAAAPRIRATVPDAKLVALLRDPVDRAHSNWTHLWSAGLEPEADFVKACRLERRRMDEGWAVFWRYLDLGRYGEQLDRLYRVFPRERVLVLRYRELRDDPVRTLDRICAFLGVRPGVIGAVPAENVTAHVRNSPANRAVAQIMRTGTRVEHLLPEPWWHRIDAFLARHLQREQRTREPLSLDQRAELVPHFVDDVKLLERLTGESFQDWIDPNRSAERPSLPITGPIGTAFGSIDRPLRDRQPDGGPAPTCNQPHG